NNTGGFNKGLLTQSAKAAPVDTPERRRPAVTGAAQQVHIMLGIDKLAPTTDCCTAVGLFITRTNQSRRTSASIAAATIDRKSTRLNSSHVSISYAVF